MILFLDADGVMHGLNGQVFSKVDLLWQILRATPACQVVFSTSWRERFTLEELIDFATAGGGEDLAPRFVGVTPVIKEVQKAHRQAEILAWLKSNGQAETPWLALDDDPLLFERGCQNLYACKVSGLTDADVPTILERIMEEPR